MKKIHLFNFLVILVSFFFSIPVVFSATATGNFTISATVTAGTCTVDSSSSNQNLGDLFATDIIGKGVYKNFSLTLSNCPSGTSSVTATFSGTADPISADWYYKNTGTATGIGIELASSGGASGLGNGKTIKATVGSNRKAVFNLSTRINKEGTPKAGTILATINVIYSYS